MFSLDGGSTFFNTSGSININDISIYPDGDGLLCQSETELSGRRDWFINPMMVSTAVADELMPGVNRGWRRNFSADDNIQQMFMRRAAATGAKEGIFTCLITGDNNPIRSLHVLYPSEL